MFESFARIVFHERFTGFAARRPRRGIHLERPRSVPSVRDPSVGAVSQLIAYSARSMAARVNSAAPDGRARRVSSRYVVVTRPIRKRKKNVKHYARARIFITLFVRVSEIFIASRDHRCLTACVVHLTFDRGRCTHNTRPWASDKTKRT